MPIQPQAEAFSAREASAGLPYLVDQGVYVAGCYSHAEPDLGGAFNPRIANCLGMIDGFFNHGKYIDEGINVRTYFADESNRILGG